MSSCESEPVGPTELVSGLLGEQLLFQPMVSSSLGHELLVRPLLHHLALLHEDDVVGLLHGLQLVSHHQDGPATGQHLLHDLRRRSQQSNKLWGVASF